jgi:hypothetical protein
MFENEISFINDFILNKTKDLGPLFTIEKFLSTDIHPSIKRYIESEINYLIDQDRKKLIDNSLFDYSGSKISNYFNLIADEIKKTKKVSYEDVKNIILQAVSFNANFVVRPKWALSKLIFGNNKSVSLNDVQSMLKYPYYYEYINNVFLAYMAKKKIMNISVTEYELIMNKIDRELFTLHQSKLVDNAIYAIADFYNIGGLNKSTLTVEAIENFLKEKNLTELLFKLKRGFPNPTKKKVDIDDIRKVLYSAFPLDSPFVEEKKSEDEISDELHFENPLKDVSVPEESTIEGSVESENEKSNDIFEEELSPSSSEENLDLAEEAIESTEEEKQDISDDVASREINVTDEKIILEETLEKSEQTAEIPEILNQDEQVLESFTKDIEENQEEEIIILDEKEEENLLNFYDNEIEISIDDDSKKEEILEETKLEFDETPISDNNDDDTAVELEKISAEDFAAENKEENSDLEKEQEETKPALDKQNFDDMFSFLSRKEIDRIIKNIFNSDSEDFANTIEKMSACNSVEEATEILDNIIKYSRIKPHSRDASSLTKAVNKYFKQGT